MIRIPALILTCLSLGVLTASENQPHADGLAALEAEAREAAVAWLDALDEARQQQAVFPMEHEERRAWSNLPHTMFARQGVAFREMDDAQRRAAHALMRSVLSSGGYQLACGIMRGDDILMATRQAPTDRRLPMYGHGFYWIALFGDVRGDGPWGFQLDGHHLALNVTAAKGQIAVTPTFLGGNPVEVAEGPYAGWRIMAEHDELGLQLYRSLSKEQRKKAVIAEQSPGDILAGPTKAGLIGDKQGIPIADLSESQRRLLDGLVHEYFATYDAPLASRSWAEFQDGVAQGATFAWLGGDEENPYAYRIHGDHHWIEFSNVRGAGSSQLGMNHIHAVWRRLGNDYGESLLKDSPARH